MATNTHPAGSRVPRKNYQCLSLRQPWGWLVVNGGKRIENRVWKRDFPKEPILLQAAKGMTPGEYEDAVAFAAKAAPRVVVPTFEKLERGGIIGRCRIVDVQLNQPGLFGPLDPWCMEGQYGYRLVDVEPLPFVPCRGELGFFWTPTDVVLALEDKGAL